MSDASRWLIRELAERYQPAYGPDWMPETARKAAIGVGYKVRFEAVQPPEANDEVKREWRKLCEAAIKKEERRALAGYPRYPEWNDDENTD